MGLCLSKKKKTPSLPPQPPPPPPPPPIPTPNDPPKVKKKESPVTTPKVAAEAVTEKKTVFVITHNRKPSLSEVELEKKEEQQIPSRKSTQREDARTSSAGAAAEEIRAVATVRTSSCTKEEVDAILIQCGRLSRSSSGKAAENAGAGHRRYSGSKRSYDFDNERPTEEELEKGGSRPSPNRRRATSRERGEDKRSGSRERGSGTGRRVSRSPGRRSEAPVSSGDKPKQQPGKMVSVPAREKGAAAVVDAAGLGVKRVAPVVANKKTGASPRSRSPANPQPQSLSRSSSKKAEQSPYRRNPLAEIEDSTQNANKMNSSGNGNKLHKPSQKGRETNPNTSNDAKTNNKNDISNCVREQLMSCRTKDQQQPESEKVDSLNPRRPRSRRASRDFDQTPSLIPSSYNSIILEDIHYYHQQNTNTAFTLPACVTKACSILEAVADLNSSNSDNRSYDGTGSENGRFGRRPGLMPFVESEIEVKDDLMEPSLHKYVTVRGEVEPQESAGSNSFVGQPCGGSPWGPNSVDSTDRCWASRSNNEDDVEEEVVEEEEKAARDFHDRGRRLRARSGEGLGTGKKDRSGGSGGKGNAGGGRALSLPVVVAAASS